MNGTACRTAIVPLELKFEGFAEDCLGWKIMVQLVVQEKFSIF